MRHLLYLIGQPGSGKSTLAASLAHSHPYDPVERPFAHGLVHADEDVFELGPRRQGFAGTDGLSMSVQPKVLAWMDGLPHHALVLGEGDRLANMKFFNAVVALGWTLTVARLAVSDTVAAYRRSNRAFDLGTGPQNDAWLRGRITKVKRLSADLGERLVILNAEQRVGTLVDELVATGDPVAVALAG